MSRPEDIPEDVWKTADLIAWARTGEVCSNANDALLADIARAILAERERCAAFHDDMAAQHEAAQSLNDEEGNRWHTGQAAIHRGYAAAIRKGEGA